MDIPPFPPHDLAKLVLGYLAEEELMTAYDEFLQGSPYLDAYRNEYDRIFMTPLKTILADYRAVKIHVETCKPHSLRKTLLQCFNLLEMFKFLISVIDPQKLHSQDHNSDKYSISKVSVSKIPCDICLSMNLKSCICKIKMPMSSRQQAPIEGESYNPINSLEATPLTDLPGHLLQSKKRDLEIDMRKSPSIEQKKSVVNTQISNIPSTTSDANNIMGANINEVGSLTINKTASIDSRQKIEEFNTILSLVCNKNVTNEKLCDNLVSNRMSNTSTFQDFVSGVHGTNQEKVTRVPDSSTTESFTPIAPKVKEKLIYISKRRPPELVDINSPTNQTIHQVSEMKLKNQDCEPNKSIDGKIKILSDVRFEKCQCNPPSTVPSVLLGTATSTPAIQKRLIINGVPGFTQKKDVGKPINYSKDEIMAMPTLIVVPAGGSTFNSAAPLRNSKLSVPKNIPMSVASTSSICDPLFIDVSSSIPPIENDADKEAKVNAEIGLIKTVDSVTHASLPKDSNNLNKTGTPHVLPPLRKSSSTPRRTSHVRVLDFATPRRILDKANLEKNPVDDDVILVSDSPISSLKCNVAEKSVPNMIISKNFDIQIRDPKAVKKKNWDEELRALLTVNEGHTQPYIPKTKNKRKNKISLNHSSTSTRENKKPKKSKKKNKSNDIDKGPVREVKTDIAIKPMINIISAEQSVCHSDHENEKSMNKTSDEHHFDTPETERLSLQNEIGAKLNISDLLETPYKQAIYDIQMETPRFLGPDLPGEPISDIKIMNIPTPRFFDTPKPTQATPSTYSSRPTDYSSGGSYYKPDDQDYPIPEIIDCNVETNGTYNKNASSDTNKLENTEVKSTKSKRPTRKCAKNVSYCNNSNIKKSSKRSSDSTEEIKPKVVTARDKQKKCKPPKSKSNMKTEKYTSPLKKDISKSFMKIKPKCVTPVKDILSKNRKILSDFSYSARKKNAIKDKNRVVTPLETTMPPKSRRKSSTPRKLHCSKTFHSSTSSNTSPDIPKQENSTRNEEINICVSHDSYNQQPPLGWSDNDLQDAKQKDNQEHSVKDGEDSITKIKEYIESIDTTKLTTSTTPTFVGSRSFHHDLVKRGLDVETARIIERDLLDTPPIQDGVVQSTSNEVNKDITSEKVTVSDKTDLVTSEVNNDGIEEPEDECDDIQFDVHEGNEDTSNYFVCEFNETTFVPNNIVPLKDKFCMEVCLDDGVSIRLRATTFNVMFDEDPLTYTEYDKKEIESAVTSISNIDKLYTPVKDHRVQCYEIFDSTLTSIDTPLKVTSPKEKKSQESITKIVLEVENTNNKSDNKKRKRVQYGASDEGGSNIKRTKIDTQYLLDPANIQNIDIESVLSKLHGP